MSIGNCWPFIELKTEYTTDILIETIGSSIYRVKNSKNTPLNTAELEKLECHYREYLNDRVFIEAEELLMILKKDNELNALRAYLLHIAKCTPTAAETREFMRQEWDKMLGRLSISEWTFTGVNVATSPLPFSGAITALAQTGVNRYLKNQSS